MYISAFWSGVITTLFAETVAIIAAAVVSYLRHKK